MFLPGAVSLCIEILERAGFEAYAVGGCVRDSLLGKDPHDYDLCTNATPQQIAELFADYTLVRAGEKHGTIGVVIEKEVIEITTFRTDGGYRDGRHPDWVRFVSCIEEDLARRDFTINAMAYNPSRGYVDPFGGQRDLQAGILRTVGTPEDRFSEDALRILRGVRFAVRFGLQGEEKTLQAMTALAPMLDKLAKERVFDELCKLLPLVSAEDLSTYQDILVQVVPVLSDCIGFAQHNSHHLYDVYTHTAHVVEAVPADLTLRWAALLHDCGKPACFQLDEKGKGHFYGHAKVSAQLADNLLLLLKAPNALRERVVFLVGHHMTELTPDKKLLRKWLGKYGVDVVFDLLTLQQADFEGKGTGKECGDFAEIRSLLEEILKEASCLTIQDLAVDGRDLLAVGFSAGKMLGACLNYLLEQVQDEQLPNEKQALLDSAKTYLLADIPQ